MEMFKIVDTNPNDVTGGGGCLCTVTRNADTKGPFAAFYATDMESPVSPHVIICKGCALAVARAMGGEALAGGERMSGPRINVPDGLPKPVAGPSEDQPEV